MCIFLIFIKKVDNKYYNINMYLNCLHKAPSQKYINANENNIYVIIYNTDMQHNNVHRCIIIHSIVICICNLCN